MVEFDRVGLRYGPDAEVLADISFNLQPGSFYFLTGASGAGKREQPRRRSRRSSA